MVDKRRFNRSVLELVKGDMTEMETEALVYYAESDLTLGAGFGTAIAVQQDARFRRNSRIWILLPWVERS